MRRSQRHQASYPLDEGWRRITLRQARPMQIPELIRDSLVVLACIVDDHRQQERLVGRHQVGPIDCELPLKSEITLIAIVRVLRDDRNE
jgi:hypothetical protein